MEIRRTKGSHFRSSGLTVVVWRWAQRPLKPFQLFLAYQPVVIFLNSIQLFCLELHKHQLSHDLLDGGRNCESVQISTFQPTPCSTWSDSHELARMILLGVFSPPKAVFCIKASWTDCFLCHQGYTWHPWKTHRMVGGWVQRACTALGGIPVRTCPRFIGSAILKSRR